MDNDTQLLKHNQIVPGDAVGLPNPRQKFDPVELMQLGESISKEGLQDALKVWETQIDGKTVYGLLDGERRWRAIGNLIAKKEAGDLATAGIACKIHHGDASSAAVIAATCNIQRADLTDFERAKLLDQIRELRGGKDAVKLDELCAIVHKSKAWVSKILSAYTAATPALLDAWAKGKIPTDTVQDIAKDYPATKDPEKQEAQVKKQLQIRSIGTKSAKGAARDEGKANKKAKKGDKKPSPAKLDLILATLAEAPIDNRYVRGVADALAFALGQIDEKDLAKEYHTWQKEFAKGEKEAERAAKEAEKAKGKKTEAAA